MEDPAVLPAGLNHMEEWKFLGGLDGEGGDGEGVRGRRRKAGEAFLLPPHWGGKQLSHVQVVFSKLNNKKKVLLLSREAEPAFNRLMDILRSET